MAILNNNPLVGASGNQGGYNINNSLRFRNSASAYLSRTPAGAGNRKTWTWSAWVKRGNIDAEQFLFGRSTVNLDTGYTNIQFNGSMLEFSNFSGGINVRTTQLFRDPSAWYHIVVALDTTQATASNRVKFYINGSQVTAFSNANYPTLNQDLVINDAAQHLIGARTGTSLYFDGYMTEINFIDGQALTPSSFGETDTTTGVWKPKAYTGTYGTNGFYLKFSDIATTSGSNAGLGKDFSGNGNYWTTNNISVTSGTTYDAMTDSPTNTSATVANYAVLNPIAGQGNGTYSDGNLAYLNGVSATWKSGVASIGASSGKYYFEYTITAVSSSNYFYLGVAGSTYNGFASYLGKTSDSWAFQWNGASSNKINNDVSTTVSTAGSISVNDVIQVAIDLGTGSIWWGRNNTWVQGDPTAGTGASYTNLSGTILPAFAVYTNGGDKIAANFGQRPFAYTPPTGFVRLNTFNLPTPTILQGNKYMDATLYTGNGANRSITNAGAFKPDAIWIKTRSAGAYNHHLVDSVRGANKNLRPNLTGAEDTTTDQVTAINSNGFSLGVDTAGPADSEVNVNGNTYVAWQWQAGQGSTSSNTSGSITSTVSVNTTAGFSIVTYTGTGANATVGHGLGVAPKMIIVKNRSITQNWIVYHTSLTSASYYILLNTTGAQDGPYTTIWNGTAPTSTVFSIGTDSSVSGNGNSLVAYCFAEIAGFSKFGSYTGNGSADGPFVFTNLKPRFIMIKRTDSTSNWTILDTAREGYNVDNDPLYPNLSNAEGTTDLADILSNGFKLRSTDTSVNANAGTYIYACFSSNPFKNSTAV